MVESDQIMNDFKVEMNPDCDDLSATGCAGTLRRAVLCKNRGAMSSQHRRTTRQTVDVLDMEPVVYAHHDKASAVDLYSRKLFPLGFIILTLCYWILYTYLIEDQSYRSVIQTEKDSYHQEE